MVVSVPGLDGFNSHSATASVLFLSFRVLVSVPGLDGFGSLILQYQVQVTALSAICCNHLWQELFARAPTRSWILYGNVREFGDAGGSPRKRCLFFLTAVYPGIRLSGDRVKLRVKHLVFRGVWWAFRISCASGHLQTLEKGPQEKLCLRASSRYTPWQKGVSGRFGPPGALQRLITNPLKKGVSGKAVPPGIFACEATRAVWASQASTPFHEFARPWLLSSMWKTTRTVWVFHRII